MKIRASVGARLGLLVALVWVLIPSSIALAQDEPPSRPSMAAMGGLILVMVILGLLFYIYLALALQTIATKTNTENTWLAWIPIANFILMLNIAQKPIWWILLLLIPFVNLIILIIVWMGIAEARGKPGWWGILMIVPVANIIVPGYLAWAD